MKGSTGTPMGGIQRVPAWVKKKQAAEERQRKRTKIEKQKRLLAEGERAFEALKRQRKSSGPVVSKTKR